MKTKREKDNIKVNGHSGTWYLLGERRYNGKLYRLLEHEIHGEDTGGLIVDRDNEEVIYPAWNGWSDLEEYIDFDFEEDYQ